MSALANDWLVRSRSRMSSRIGRSIGGVGTLPSSSLTIYTDGVAQGTKISPSIARLMVERTEKMEKLRKEGLLRGRVIVLPPTIPEPPAETEPESE